MNVKNSLDFLSSKMEPAEQNIHPADKPSLLAEWNLKET
jgi:hypothetical protein